MSQTEKIPAFLSIVMPVYNEADVIAGVVADYLHVGDRFERAELIVVNDASNDNSGEVLGRITASDSRVRVFTNESNSGHGPSLVRAYRAAQGDYVFHVDSDNQFVADDFWKLWQRMKTDQLDAVIGVRVQRKDAFARLVLTTCLKIFLFLSFQKWLPDANSPFRLYKKEALSRILPLISDHARLPSICLAIGTSELNIPSGWVDVRHLPRLSGQSFVRSFKIFRLSFTSIGELLEFRKTLRVARRVS